MACVWHAPGNERCMRQCPVIKHRPQRWRWKRVKVLYMMVWHVCATKLCLGSNKLFSPSSFLFSLLEYWCVISFIFYIQFNPNSFDYYILIFHCFFHFSCQVWSLLLWYFISLLLYFLNSSLSIYFKFIFISNLVYIVFIVVCFVLNFFLLYFFQFNPLASFLLRIFLCCFFPFYKVSFYFMARVIGFEG